MGAFSLPDLDQILNSQIYVQSWNIQANVSNNIFVSFSN